jgi:hypothetical protein
VPTTGWADIFTIPLLAGCWGFALVLAGLPLLWAFLRHRPIPRREWLHAVAHFIYGGLLFTAFDAASQAYQRGLLSLSVSVASAALIFLIAAAAMGVMHTRYPLPDKGSA